MNYTKIFALATGTLLWMSSCTSSSDLDKLPDAAVRTQEAISETVSKLEGHDGYWRLTYYPDTKRAYGGYSMYVQFKDGRVTALSELSTTATNSTYSVKNIDMPTLALTRVAMSSTTSSPLPSTSVMHVVVTSSSS